MRTGSQSRTGGSNRGVVPPRARQAAGEKGDGNGLETPAELGRAFARLYRDVMGKQVDAARANAALRAVEGALKLYELRLRFGPRK